MKKILALLLALVMVFALVACGSTGDDKGKTDDAGNDDAASGEVKAVMISVMKGGTYWGPIEEGWLAQCAEYGWTGAYWTPVTTNSQTEMLELAETAISQGFKILCVCGTDANMWSDVIGRAKEAGCIVIGVASDMGPELLGGCVGPDYYDMGYTVGCYAGNMMNERGETEANVFSIQTNFTEGQGQDLQVDGFLDGITETFKGKVTDLGADTNDSSVSIAQDKMNAMYLVHPEMNVIYGAETYAMIAAASFIQEHGLQGKVYTGTPDSELENLQLLIDGAFTWGSQLDVVQEGKSCAEAAKILLDGGTPETYYVPVPLTMYDTSNLLEFCESYGIDASSLKFPE